MRPIAGIVLNLPKPNFGIVFRRLNATSSKIFKKTSATTGDIVVHWIWKKSVRFIILGREVVLSDILLYENSKIGTFFIMI